MPWPFDDKPVSPMANALLGRFLGLQGNADARPPANAMAHGSPPAMSASELAQAISSRPWWHGGASPDPIEQFDLARALSSNGDNTLGQGVYFAPSRGLAMPPAGGGVHPYSVNVQNPFLWDRNQVEEIFPASLLCRLGLHSWLWHECNRRGIIEHEGWCRYCQDDWDLYQRLGDDHG